MAMDIIPMRPPDGGPSRYAVTFFRSTLSHALMTFMTMLPMKQALSLDREYSMATIALLSVCVSLTIEAVCIPLAFACFPVPFREMIGLPVSLTSVVVYNLIFARSTMRKQWRKHRLQLYVPLVGVQVTLFYLFLALSVGFSYLSATPQTILTLTFPIVKMTLNHFVWRHARELDDISTDVTICMLEISGSHYQTVCMQFVASPALSLLVMASDIAQAVHVVRSYLHLDYLGDGQRTIATAVKIIASAILPTDGLERRRSSFSFDRSIAITVSIVSTGWGDHDKEDCSSLVSHRPDPSSAESGIPCGDRRQIRRFRKRSAASSSVSRSSSTQAGIESWHSVPSQSMCIRQAYV